MTEVEATTDPRPRLSAALDQTQYAIDAIEDADLGRPTPCAEYDVRTLLAHLVAVLRKLAVVGNGGDMSQVKDPADDHTDDWGGAFRAARADLEQIWAPDSALGKSYTLAWGAMTGRELLDAYAHEFTVHVWDLSRATGGGHELDRALAEAALDWYTRNVPAEGRGEGGPFAPVVTVADDADTYTRLAAFVGRPV
ncbi:TIGR03086 family metal-binding protein [Streptomyces boluensis]|uniref:TIGR03086 family protein n=1 Tax=Streptomyces boluensis TaxID=1775135 RepID=A0A964XPB3_9ACTN|nr:TIGR03086 family metal-binding protein [Streptomyces boluensis]NBE56574.1 TIGR03086 family protein [Streptomyces boluensis]